MCVEVGLVGAGVDRAGDEGCLGGHVGAEVRVVDGQGEGGWVDGRCVGLGVMRDGLSRTGLV